MKPSLVVIGLGNPGAQYETTRHNVGFWMIDALAKEFGEGDWTDAPKFAAKTLEARIVMVPVLLVKPQTFMNRSGECARKITDFYKLNPAEQLFVCVDDIDLPLGELRLRRTGGPGTHNGLRSFEQQFGEDYARLRLGLGAPEKADLANWVLSRPEADELKVLQTSADEVPALVKKFVLGE